MWVILLTYPQTAPFARLALALTHPLPALANRGDEKVEQRADHCAAPANDNAVISADRVAKM